jgi:diacylglycerol kinase family enzyme
MAAIGRVLSSSGRPHRIVKFTHREQAIHAIEEAEREGFDTLLIGGGDGTIHHILNLSFGKGFTYGLIPLGTVSTLARSLRIPHEPTAACRIALSGRVRWIDVGRAAGRLFVCFGSVGLDASVVHTIDERFKLRWEGAAFAVQGVRRLLRLREIAPIDVEIAPSGESVRGYSLLISNLPVYAGFCLFSEKIDDGKMEMLLFRKNTIRHYLWGVARFLISRRRGGAKDSLLHRAEVEQVTARSHRKLFLQLDGEPVPHRAGEDIIFEVLPRAAAFLVP